MKEAPKKRHRVGALINTIPKTSPGFRWYMKRPGGIS
jgi:hypothetical protein